MADIRAFRGFRYDLGRVGKLADVIAPPYDVIDDALQQQLYDASPYNAVRIELTKDDPEAEIDKYTAAARTLNTWLNENIIKQDTARMLYILEQEFTIEGATHRRRGFFARVRLEPFGTGRIFPHEQTLAGPKADRLKLYNATNFNLSPIFGLYPDSDDSLFNMIEPSIRNAPPITATDHLGVIHRLWTINDSALISNLVGKMGPKPIFIADGHHRYETGLKYLEEQRALGNIQDEESPANFCLMMLVGMSDPGLIVLPTHRLLNGWPNVTGAQVRTALSPYFQIVAEFGTNANECWEHLQMDGGQTVLGFGIAAEAEQPQEWFAAKLLDTTIMQKLAPERSEEWRSLAVSILHKLVLEQLIPRTLGATPACRYVHLMSEVTDALNARSCQVACLVPPVGMEHVELIAGNHETMPPKSTYFYPKLPTGLVYHSLKKD